MIGIYVKLVMKTLPILSVVFAAVFAEKFSKNFYFELEDQSDWMGAFDKCREKGLRLATIRSRDEQDNVRRYIEYYNITGTALHIGGTALFIQDVFMWHGAGDRIVYTNWLAKQPDTRNGTKNCIRVLTGWKAYNCAEVRPYICEDMTI